VLIAPRRRCDGYQLLYHLEALQLSFSPSLTLFSQPLARDTLPRKRTSSTLDKRLVEGGAPANNPAALSSNSHALQIADMIRAIHEDGSPLVDGYAARHPVEIILGIYQSARTRQEVTFP
jgi:predicted dehydrogenase